MTEMQSATNNFLFHCKYEKNLSPKTLKAYAIDLTQFRIYLNSVQKITNIEHVNNESLRDYIQVLSENHKPSTVKRKIATMKSFFNHAEFSGLLSANPFIKMRIKIKEGHYLPRTIPLKHISKLFRYVYGLKYSMANTLTYKYKAIVRDVAVLELLFATGIRVAELCNIKLENIDLTKGSLRIIGKGQSERVIPICSSDTLHALKEYLNLFRNDITLTGVLFINRLNQRLSEQSVRFMIDKHSKSINLESKITPHMFRHSVASLLVANGVDISHIQALLGHKSILTTQIYLHINADSHRKMLTSRHPRKMIQVHPA